MSNQAPTVDQVIDRLVAATIGKPIIVNNLRGELVEAIIDLALEPDWKWVSGDWAGWDFEHIATGKRLEVKQSAARQTWGKSISPPSFDIRTRQTRLEGATEIKNPTGARFAHVYIFAHHADDTELADHRDVTSWSFYIVGSEQLPAQKSIALSGIQKLTTPVDWPGIRARINEIAGI